MSGPDRPGEPDGGRAGGDPDDPPPARIAVVGPGPVGLSLAAALSDAGRTVALFGRRPERPGFLDAYPGVRYRAVVPPADPSAVADSGPPRRDGAPAGREAATDPEGGGPGGLSADRGARSTLIFSVPDDALAGAASDWARALPSGAPTAPSGGSARDGAGPVALHTSGVHGADVLAPLRDAGLAVAAWHPLTALSAPRADAFDGITFTVEGDEAAARRAEALAEAVGGRRMRLEPGASARYHAAAVFASNYLVACLAVAARELSAATGGEGSLDDLLPLARAAVENLSEEDLAEGVTGPIARGDAGTVRRHLRALEPESAELYRRLARELLDVVEGRVGERAAGELRRILGEPGEEGA